jgi:uncharacterized protein
MRATWQPTIIAAVAAAASYGSLLVTASRSFRDFGFIAASGMLLCWAATTLMLPSLLLLSERIGGGGRPRSPRLARLEMAYGKLFAPLVGRAPRLLLLAGVAVALVGTASAVRFAMSDPMEYDMRKVDNDHSHTAELHRAWDVCNEVLGSSQGAMVVATDTVEEARDLQSILQARWEAAPPGGKPFVAVHSLWDFVPADQEAKIPILRALSRRVERAHKRGFLGEADWAGVRDLVAPEDIAPFGLAGLPRALAEPFTERDGTRGTLVLIEAAPATSDDLRDLVRFADSYRETRLPSGKVVHGSDRAVIFADMLKAVVRDVPRAITLALALTLLTVFVTFRRGPHLLAVLFALWVGVGGVAIFLWYAGVRLNFLNFAALPVTFGIGVDYAINVAQRYRADGAKNILAALRTSGGAVVLCSLTTMLGYFALIGSHNQAIRGLGEIAAVGEVSCLLAAVVVLPALWLTVERRLLRGAATQAAPSGPSPSPSSSG